MQVSRYLTTSYTLAIQIWAPEFLLGDQFNHKLNHIVLFFLVRVNGRSSRTVLPDCSLEDLHLLAQFWRYLLSN